VIADATLAGARRSSAPHNRRRHRDRWRHRGRAALQRRVNGPPDSSGL